MTLGPSAAGTDITIAPDGTRAYTVFNVGKPCVSVIDVDPASLTYNQEIAVIPTTGKTLGALAMNSEGNRLFVVSAGTNELIVIDTDTGRQTQRTPLVRNRLNSEIKFGVGTTTVVDSS